MIYKLKHIPTGLYYQPHKHRGSNLSKKGKIYQTSTHGLSSAYRSKKDYFYIYVEKDSLMHKTTKDILVYEECNWNGSQLGSKTNINDWIIEEIK